MNRLASFFWNPPSAPLDGDGWVLRQELEAGGVLEKAPPAACVVRRYQPDHPLAQKILGSLDAFMDKLPKKRQPSPEKPLQVIDVGSGVGTLGRLIWQNRDSTHVTLFDLNDDPHFHPEGRLDRKIGDMRALTDAFKKGSVDVVLSSRALEYGGLLAFQKAADVLKSGGLLIAVVMGAGPIARQAEAYYTFRYRVAAGLWPVRALMPEKYLKRLYGHAVMAQHVNRCTFASKSSVQKMLGEAGFSDITVDQSFAQYPQTSEGDWLVVAKKR